MPGCRRVESNPSSPGHVGQESGGLIHQHYGQQDGDEADREVTSQKEHSKGSNVVSPRGDRVDARGERPAEEHLGTPNRAIARVALHVARSHARAQPTSVHHRTRTVVQESRKCFLVPDPSLPIEEHRALRSHSVRTCATEEGAAGFRRRGPREGDTRTTASQTMRSLGADVNVCSEELAADTVFVE